MNRKQLLEFMKGKISQYYYDILYAWTLYNNKTFFIFDKKYKIAPGLYGGYFITTNNFLGLIDDDIFVYPE
jgi:hypothetical protein